MKDDTVTLGMIAEHVGKSKAGVRRALESKGFKVERVKGEKETRVLLSAANTFMRRQWPERFRQKGPLSLDPVSNS